MQRISHISVGLLGTLCVSLAFAAQPLEPVLLSHPDPARAQYYQQHADEVVALRERTEVGDVDDRVAALEELSVKFPEAADLYAVKLVGSDAEPVAKQAAELLAAAIVMSDHPHGTHSSLTPQQQYVAARHEEARAALRGALGDKRPEVRRVAATTLSSLSDVAAIDVIDAGTATGTFSEVEAVNYFGLANPKVGAKYMTRYLEEGSPSAQAGAATYLGANAEHQAKVRDKVFLNKQADPVAREAAAKVLSTYDKTFESYALSIANDSTVPPRVLEETIEGYLNNKEAKQGIAPNQVKQLREVISTYEAARPDANLSEIKTRLGTM